MQTCQAPPRGQVGVLAGRPAGEDQARRADLADELQWMMHAVGSQFSAACEAISQLKDGRSLYGILPRGFYFILGRVRHPLTGRYTISQRGVYSY